jgi:hypothetical protein
MRPITRVITSMLVLVAGAVRRTWALGALVSAAVLILAVSATITQARDYHPTLTVSPANGPPGSQVTLTGRGFDPRLVNRPIYFDSHASGSGYLKEVSSGVAGASGCDPCGYTIAVNVPGDAPRGPAQFVQLRTASSMQASADFTVTPSSGGRGHLGFTRWPRHHPITRWPRHHPVYPHRVMAR